MFRHYRSVPRDLCWHKPVFAPARAASGSLYRKTVSVCQPVRIHRSRSTNIQTMRCCATRWLVTGS